MFKKYLKKQKNYIYLTIVFTIIFLGTMFLYNQEIEAIIYASTLCILISIPVIAISYKNFVQKQKGLQEYEKTEPFFDGNLPLAASQIEIQYQSIIGKIKNQLDEQRNFMEKWRQDNSDYYTTWVHQIKTPIAAMKLMLQQEDSEESLNLQSELFKIEEYVNMALVYVRLDDDSSDFVIKQYNLDEIIRKTIRKYASQFILKNISLRYDGTDKRVITDEKWLAMLLDQIISNSIKYTPSGMVEIVVLGDSIFIKDTGIGIASEDIPRIFDKGYTGYNGRNSNKSTGLGLYLAKNIAEKIGCKIEVKSQIGDGSVFEIQFCKDLTKM